MIHPPLPRPPPPFPLWPGKHHPLIPLSLDPAQVVRESRKQGAVIPYRARWHVCISMLLTTVCLEALYVLLTGVHLHPYAYQFTDTNVSRPHFQFTYTINVSRPLYPGVDYPELEMAPGDFLRIYDAYCQHYMPPVEHPHPQGQDVHPGVHSVLVGDKGEAGSYAGTSTHGYSGVGPRESSMVPACPCVPSTLRGYSFPHLRILVYSNCICSPVSSYRGKHTSARIHGDIKLILQKQVLPWIDTESCTVYVVLKKHMLPCLVRYMSHVLKKHISRLIQEPHPTLSLKESWIYSDIHI